MRPGIFVRAIPLALMAMSFASRSDAGNRFVTMPRDYQDTPAATYGGLSGADCISALDHRHVPYLTTTPVPGVDAPVRLAGPLHGVTFRQENRSTDEALNADGGIMDCRLAVALDDLSELLASRGIVTVGFISAYRRDETGKIPAGQRHPSGLAIDISTFRHSDGTSWEVERDFHGRVGAKTCGRGAQSPGQRDAPSLGLRRLVCDTGATRVFNLVLTPNYDTEHHNHVHLEVRRDIRWFLVQ